MKITKGAFLKQFFSIFALASFVLLLAGIIFTLHVKAGSVKGNIEGLGNILDSPYEILNYTVTVEVNEDATLHMVYHMEWRVKNNNVKDPLNQVMIGVPNNHCKDIKAISSTIGTIKYASERGGSFVRIGLDRGYRAGEEVTIEFELVQDYMYQMNLSAEGETVYQFTPGWFDDIYVDELAVKWKTDKVLSVSPGAETNQGYYTWITPLSRKQKYTVSVTYPNDAFHFDAKKKIKTREPKPKMDPMSNGEWKGLLVLIGIVVAVVIFIGNSFLNNLIGRGTSTEGTQAGTEINRKIIEYYKNCPNCGAPRPKGKEICKYCGTNFIKSE